MLLSDYRQKMEMKKRMAQLSKNFQLLSVFHGSFRPFVSYYWDKNVSVPGFSTFTDKKCYNVYLLYL